MRSAVAEASAPRATSRLKNRSHLCQLSAARASTTRGLSTSPRLARTARVARQLSIVRDRGSMGCVVSMPEPYVTTVQSGLDVEMGCAALSLVDGCYRIDNIAPV